MRVYDIVGRCLGWCPHPANRRQGRFCTLGRIVVEDAAELWPVKPSWPLVTARIRPEEREARMAKALSVIRKDAVIADLDKCVGLLRECASAQDAKKLMDVGVAAEVWARRQKLGEEAEIAAGEFIVRAERRLGEILKQTERHEGGRPPEKPLTRKVGVFPTLEDLGISWNVSSRAQRIAAVPEEKFEIFITHAKRDSKPFSRNALVAKMLADDQPKKEKQQVQMNQTAQPGLERLILAWNKATPSEQRAFVNWLKEDEAKREALRKTLAEKGFRI